MFVYTCMLLTSQTGNASHTSHSWCLTTTQNTNHNPIICWMVRTRWLRGVTLHLVGMSRLCLSGCWPSWGMPWQPYRKKHEFHWSRSSLNWCTVAQVQSKPSHSSHTQEHWQRLQFNEQRNCMNLSCTGSVYNLCNNYIGIFKKTHSYHTHTRAHTHVRAHTQTQRDRHWHDLVHHCALLSTPHSPFGEGWLSTESLRFACSSVSEYWQLEGWPNWLMSVVISKAPVGMTTWIPACANRIHSVAKENGTYSLK